MRTWPSSWWSPWFIVLLVCVFLAAAVVGFAGEPGPGEARIHVFPRMTLWSPAQPAFINVHVDIMKPTPEFFCPAVHMRVFAVGGEIGIDAYNEDQESDCNPWTEGGWTRDKEGNIVDTQATGSVPWTWSMDSRQKRWRLGPGEWTVEVTLTQGRKRVMLQAFVTVHGGASRGSK
jgi:hypothetical protein